MTKIVREPCGCARLGRSNPNKARLARPICFTKTAKHGSSRNGQYVTIRTSLLTSRTIVNRLL
jgi:hypothetical protein